MQKFDLMALLRRRRISLAEWLSYNQLNSLKDFNDHGERLAGELGCFISAEMKEKINLHFPEPKKQATSILTQSEPEIVMVEDETKQIKKSQNNKKNKKNSSKENNDDLESDSLVQDKIEDEPKELNENESSE